MLKPRCDLKTAAAGSSKTFLTSYWATSSQVPTSVTSGENTESQISIMQSQSQLGPTHIPVAWGFRPCCMLVPRIPCVLYLISLAEWLAHVIRGCLYYMSAHTMYVWLPFSSTETGGRAMLQ